MPIYNKLSVASISLDIAAGQKEENMMRAAKAMAKLPAGVDIIALPELFSTSFIPDANACASLAEDNDGPTMEWAKRTSKLTGAAIAGSFIARQGGELFNRAFFIEPAGDAAFYDKRHTFSIGRESEIFSRGQSEPPIERFRGWNITLFVCYDLRFPAWMRNVGLKYDLAIVPAAWPVQRSYAWDALLRARAIENQAYFIGANRSGEDEFGQYAGTARIFDFCGQPIGKETQYGCLHALLQKGALQKARESMPVSRDADEFELII